MSEGILVQLKKRYLVETFSKFAERQGLPVDSPDEIQQEVFLKKIIRAILFNKNENKVSFKKQTGNPKF